MTEPKLKPKSIPRALKGEAPTTKLVWAWLAPQGDVGYSIREIEEALNLSHRAVYLALNRLRELKLLVDIGEHEERYKGAFRVKGFADPRQE